MREKPSKVNEKYWIFARSPEGTIREGISWFKTNSSSYVKSGKMFPRDIYSDDMAIPATEEYRMLLRLDHEAIESASRDSPKSYRLSYGKWLVFAEMDQIDSLWEDLADKIESGKMPYDAKVANMQNRALQVSPHIRAKGCRCSFFPFGVGFPSDLFDWRFPMSKPQLSRDGIHGEVVYVMKVDDDTKYAMIRDGRTQIAIVRVDQVIKDLAEYK